MNPISDRSTLLASTVFSDKRSLDPGNGYFDGRVVKLSPNLALIKTVCKSNDLQKDYFLLYSLNYSLISTKIQVKQIYLFVRQILFVQH